MGRYRGCRARTGPRRPPLCWTTRRPLRARRKRTASSRPAGQRSWLHQPLRTPGRTTPVPTHARCGQPTCAIGRSQSSLAQPRARPLVVIPGSYPSRPATRLTTRGRGGGRSLVPRPLEPLFRRHHRLDDLVGYGKRVHLYGLVNQPIRGVLVGHRGHDLSNLVDYGTSATNEFLGNYPRTTCIQGGHALDKLIPLTDIN